MGGTCTAVLGLKVHHILSLYSPPYSQAPPRLQRLPLDKRRGVAGIVRTFVAEQRTATTVFPRFSFFERFFLFFLRLQIFLDLHAFCWCWKEERRRVPVEEEKQKKKKTKRTAMDTVLPSVYIWGNSTAQTYTHLHRFHPPSPKCPRNKGSS